MMIKANGEYLDFDDVVEVERQIKLFEDISTTDGDYSYEFDLEDTGHNVKSLGNPTPDNIRKQVYQKIPADLLNDEGDSVQKGYIRIEGWRGKKITCSFFGGNNNWFGLLSGPLSDIDFSDLDVDQTEANISIAIFNTEGIVFPVVDNGVLVTRGYQLMKVEDFVAGIYVKTVFKRIFQQHGIKIQGDLLDDPEYDAAITLRNSRDQDQIDARSTFAFTDNSPNPQDNTYHKMVWTDDSNFPYSDGAQDNFDLSLGRYTADVQMKVNVKLNITQDLFFVVNPFWMAFYINGVLFKEKRSTFGFTESQSFELNIVLQAGDYLEVFTKNDVVVSDDPITSATLKITPTFIYKVFGNSTVPQWSQQKYVSNVLMLFNTLPSYNAKTGTLTLDIFDKIKSKEELDLSPYISETQVDFAEFISDYGKRNLFSYNEVDIDDLRKYKISSFFKYAQGSIDVDNDFLSDSEEVLSSDFSNPLSYINPVFDMSMERTNLIELDEEITVDITGVTEVLSDARFAVAEDEFALNDLVRITDSTVEIYNGDWNVKSFGAGWIELEGISFAGDARAQVTKMNFVYSNSDDIFILHHIPLYAVINFSGNGFIQLNATQYQTISTAFFSLLNTGRQINEDFKQSLSFGGIDNPLFYQRTLLDTYWNLFSRVLNDPVKLLNVCNLPLKVFLEIDFLRPLTIRTLESTNQYYCNRIRGYLDSSKSCVVETIKLP